MQEILNSDIFASAVVPLLICIARIIDVSLGTLRIIYVSRGMKFLAPVLGFFEILIWLIAFGQILQNLSNVTNYIAFALGFAVGNYLGILIEHRLAMGKVVVRVITGRNAADLITFLRSEGLSVTVVDAEGTNGPVNLLFTVINRSQLPVVTDHIKRFNPRAFYTVEDVRFVSGGIFSPAEQLCGSGRSGLLGAKKVK